MVNSTGSSAGTTNLAMLRKADAGKADGGKADGGKAGTAQGTVQACECDLDSNMLRLELEERARGCVGTSSLDAQHGRNLLLSYVLHSCRMLL